MPFEVRGADGRLINAQLNDTDARDLAARILGQTGEEVVLTPWVEKDGAWELSKPKSAAAKKADTKQAETPAGAVTPVETVKAKPKRAAKPRKTASAKK